MSWKEGWTGKGRCCRVWFLNRCFLGGFFFQIRFVTYGEWACIA